jgi:ubiquinone/menaquinone biosynthesis C-methylase UbiE
MTAPAAQIAAGGNVFDKYRSTNPLYRRLVAGFIESVASLVGRAAPRSVLDVGCADGELARRVLARCGPEQLAGLRYVGLDVAPAQIAAAKELSRGPEFVCADAASIPFDDGAFDLVLGLEVLEHVADPAQVLSEICRVASRRVVISVPWEPLWRILNVCRLKYLSDLGNTPGHIQHFSRRAIRELFARYCSLEEELHPFPWTMLAGQPRRMTNDQ